MPSPFTVTALVSFSAPREVFVNFAIDFVVLMVPVSLLCFVLDYFMRRRTRHLMYMVTNHRVVWLMLYQPQVHSLALRQNMVSGTVMRASGRGDIIFTADASGDAVDSFHNIPHVRKVVSLINDLSAGR